MKPHLKLHLDGHISVVRMAAESTPEQARQHLVARHGSLLVAARAMRVPYWALCAALGSPVASTRAGHVARCRQMLGLTSEPSDQALRIARLKEVARRPA
ncbi:MAG: hypothetical protein QM702_04385 [Rubrivivax sp.]